MRSARAAALILSGAAVLAAAGLAAAAVAAPPAAAPPAAAPPAATPADPAPQAGFVEETVVVPGLGRVPVFRPDPIERTRGVILFLSGDGGFKLGVVDMARRSAPRAIVVGLSLPAWKKQAEEDPGRCWYPAGDLESIAQAVEKTYRLPRYLRPIVIGYSSGATAVWGVLAQAPAETFAGGVSLGFCDDLEVGRPWCPRGEWKPAYDGKNKKSILPPRPDLPERETGGPRWFVLQGEIDQVCDPETTARFTAQVPAARLVRLPKVGHGFSVTGRWGGPYDQAVEALLDPSPAWEAARQEGERGANISGPREVRGRLQALDLPLEVEWPEGARRVLIFVSGDGGWAELDRQVAAALVERGVAVIGWNTLRYFWEPKSPERFRSDLGKVVEAIPEAVSVFAGGYSFGAEVVPVTIAPGRADAAGPSRPFDRIEGLVLLGPGPYAAFEVSPLDWLRSREAETKHPVRRAVASLGGLPVLCLEPGHRADSGCPDQAPGLSRVQVPGGHHFAGDFEGLAERIADFLERPDSGEAPAR